MTRAYVALGSNLGDREEAIRQAIELLGDDPQIEVVRESMIRETEPVGYRDQPRFLNGVVELETDLSARDLLGRLLAIEQRLGRDRGERPRFGPRTIDLDLLVYGDETIDEPGLEVPHPRLHERAFVLEPLAELDPELVIPGRGRVSEMIGWLE